MAGTWCGRLRFFQLGKQQKQMYKEIKYQGAARHHIQQLGAGGHVAAIVQLSKSNYQLTVDGIICAAGSLKFCLEKLELAAKRGGETVKPKAKPKEAAVEYRREPRKLGLLKMLLVGDRFYFNSQKLRAVYKVVEPPKMKGKPIYNKGKVPVVRIEGYNQSGVIWKSEDEIVVFLRSELRKQMKKDTGDLAEELKQDGMKRATDHADRKVADWSEKAAECVGIFMTHNPGKPFTSEDVRNKFKGVLPEPPDARAWGSVMTRLKSAGKIKAHGTAKYKNANCHKGYTTQWIAA